MVLIRGAGQCKNTKDVALDDLAKEIGHALMLHSQVVMMVTTGRIGPTVRAHAKAVHKSMALQVVLLDGDQLQKVTREPSRAALTLLDFLNEEARGIMAQKAGQLSGMTGA